MVLNMFYLKASEELSPRSWACVLDDGFTCVCPLTPFRSFPPSEVRVRGVRSLLLLLLNRVVSTQVSEAFSWCWLLVVCCCEDCCLRVLIAVWYLYVLVSSIGARCRVFESMLRLQ